MSNNDDNIIKGHDYDGIEECDHPLPNWWLFTFLGTIMFAYFYFLQYEAGDGRSIADELKSDLAKVEAVKKANGPKGDSEEELTKLLASGPALALGKTEFAAKCAACHGAELQGVIGPNLTDDFWIHGKGQLTDIAMVIRKGVLDKGMPSWEGQLKDDEIKAVTVFVASRRGSHPTNPKAPQGEKSDSN